MHASGTDVMHGFNKIYTLHLLDASTSNDSCEATARPALSPPTASDDTPNIAHIIATIPANIHLMS